MAITLKTVLERLAAAEIRIDELERRQRGLSELETALARLGAPVAAAERARRQLEALNRLWELRLSRVYGRVAG